MIDTSLSATNVTAGTNATATQYNALRADMGTGWINPEITATYSSVTGQVGVITVPTDATTFFEVGDKIRFKQGGGYKYFYVTAVTSTSLSISGGGEYTLTNAAITDFYLSKWVSPVDWPLSETMYVTLVDGATITMNCLVAKNFKVTMGGNRTVTISNAKIGDIISLDICGAGYTPTWFTGLTLTWADGVTPTLTGSTKFDSVIFKCVATNTFYGMLAGANF